MAIMEGNLLSKRHYLCKVGFLKDFVLFFVIIIFFVELMCDFYFSGKVFEVLEENRTGTRPFPQKLACFL